jgi:Tfp pilus assembly protein PilN
VQIAALTMTLALVLLCACLVVYFGLFLGRLTRRSNRQRFVATPIPGIHRGKIAGQEFELASQLREELPRFEQGTTAALQALTERLATLEKSMQAVEYQVGRMEDVSGQLPQSPGDQGHG